VSAFSATSKVASATLSAALAVTFNESAQKFYAAAGFQPYRCFLESQT